MSPRDTAHRLPTFTSGRDGKLHARISRVRATAAAAAAARGKTLRQYFAFDSEFVFDDIYRVFDNRQTRDIFSVLKIKTIFSLTKILSEIFDRNLIVS